MGLLTYNGTVPTCACGCPVACCQGYAMFGDIYSTGLGGASTISDAANIRAWVNNLANDPCPQWPPAGGIGWEAYLQVYFDSTSSTSPNPSHTSLDCPGSQLPGSATFANSAIYGVEQDESGNLVSAYAGNGWAITPDSTAYVVGVWAAGTPPSGYYRKSCSMAGAPIGGCYLYYVPSPEINLIADAYSSGINAQAQYQIVPISNPSGYIWKGLNPNFSPGTWGGFMAGCAADPTNCDSSCLSPSPCLSPDPFYGSSPP